ncbi:MAG: aspartate aminotransferase family protein [Chthoniobacterales bacterium]
MSLDPSADEIRRWGKAAINAMADHLSSIRDRSVYPATTSAAIRERLVTALPEDGRTFDELLETFTETIVPLTRQNAHPRMFGYVQGPGTAIAAVADLLASTLNANLTVWRSAPSAVELERLTIDWIKQIVGFEADAAGLFVSGGSMANFSALASARHAVAPDASRSGMQSSSRQLRVYCSDQTHHSIAKAAALLGIGRDNVREVSTDERFKVRADELERMIEEDLAAGYLPFCIVANAGTVMTGACDQIAALRDVADRHGLWLHVDGSYGGFATLAASVHPLFAGMERADSISLDPHKWLYLPVDCGCVLYRDAAAARAAFAHEAEYTRVLAQQADESFAYWDYGPELSRRFRALKVWMMLQLVGMRPLREALEKDLACARKLEALVHASSDFEMLAPVELSIFCFRYVPTHLRSDATARDIASEQELDAVNEQLLLALQQDGNSYLSNAQINGRFGLRGCVMNFRTQLDDVRILLDDLRRLAAAVDHAT